MPRTLPDRLWVPALVGLLLGVLFVQALLVRADGDVSLLIHAAPVWTDPADDPPGSLTVQPTEEDAFDGQFFYRLGVDPFSTDDTVAGVTLDLPSLRNARWGYGALAFVASGGDRDLVPWALVGLNVVALAAVGAIGGGLARASGHHAGWGVLLVLWPGFAYSLSLDTSELVASAFALGALLALRHHRWLGATALLVAALLTRDTTAVIAVGVVAAAAWLRLAARSGPGPTGDGDPIEAGQGPTTSDPEPACAEAASTEWMALRSGSTTASGSDSSTAVLVRPTDAPAGRAEALRSAAAGLVALAAFGGWQLLQRARFGALPLTSSGDNNLSAPLGGLADQALDVLPPHGGAEAFRLLSMIGLVALLAAAALTWRRSAAPLRERLAWLPAVAVVVVLNAYLWSGATAFMRAATEAGLLSILVLLGTTRRQLLPLAAVGLSGLWALTALAQLSKLG